MKRYLIFSLIFDQIIFLKAEREKRELEEKFEKITNEVKQHADVQNVVLINNLQRLQSSLDTKEATLQTLLDRHNMDPKLYAELRMKIQNSIESKNSLIKNLKYSIHHATKVSRF